MLQNPPTRNSRPYLVLLPGYDGNGSHSFQALAKQLSNNYHLHIVNFPYRNSPGKTYTLDELVKDLHQELTNHQIGKAHLVGFSLGGFVATHYAQKYPQRVTSLSLISSSVELAFTLIRSAVLTLTSPLVRSRALANTFAAIYCSPILHSIVKYSPLPVPQANFTSQQGYVVFGTLAQILKEVRAGKLISPQDTSNIPKHALLFTDDLSMPASRYQPVLQKHGFAVQVNPTGGHALSPDYWQQVAHFIRTNCK